VFKQFGFVLCKGNTVTGIALPGIYLSFAFTFAFALAVAIPLVHKSTQGPTPQLIYFYLGKSPGFTALGVGREGRVGGGYKDKHLPKIFNRHLCTTIPVAIRCRCRCLPTLLPLTLFVFLYFY